MEALVLAVRPGRRTAYAVVYGDKTYDAGHWDLVTAEEAALRLPADDELRSMMHRLRDYVEVEALYRDVDAIVVEREMQTDMNGSLGGAVLQAGFATKKPGHEVAPDAWRARVPFDPKTVGYGPRLEIELRVQPVPVDLMLWKVIQLGRYASQHMGIVPLDAMWDDGE